MNLDKIRTARMSETEKFLLEIFDGLVEKLSGHNKEWFYYKNGNDIIFEYMSINKVLYYSLEYIHTIFRNKYYYNVVDTNKLVKSMFEQHYNLKVDAVSPY